MLARLPEGGIADAPQTSSRIHTSVAFVECDVVQDLGVSGALISLQHASTVATRPTTGKWRSAA